MIGNEIDNKCFHDYIDFIHKLTGITIDKDRSSMLVGRIRKRVCELGLGDYESYLEHVRFDKLEQSYFTNLITTNETYFYRTPRIWSFIEKDFLTANFEHGSKFLNIWSAASSTGDEAHTLGVLCQKFKDTHSGFAYRILGTDISQKVVDKAKQGLYSGRSLKRFRELRPDLFKKYMEGSDENGYQVSAQIKQNIDFKVHNLFARLEGEDKYDLILLRNVLIYFTKKDQEKVLEKIYDKLSPRGYLIIGESESLNRIDTNFESVAPLIYRPKLLQDEKEIA